MEASDRFQGLCLINAKGSEFMSYYDTMPAETRKLVRNSSFNLCAACIVNRAVDKAIKQQLNRPLPRHYELAVKEMENMIRCEETQ